jgi:hypothetical protein
MLHTKAYLPWENPQRRNYIGEAQRRRWNYVPTPQKNPLCEETQMDKKR